MLIVSDTLRRCGRCGRLLPIAAFNKSTAEGFQGYCRDCQRQWYLEHRSQHLANVNANSSRYRERNTQFVRDYLRAHPCVDCGESDIAVLEFDHVGLKTRDISRMMWGRATLDAIGAEIEQCEVRCVNCHIRRTSGQFAWRKGQEATVEPDMFQVRS